MKGCENIATKLSIEYIHNYLKDNNYKNKLISTEYINSKSHLIFTCECCGEKYSTLWNTFLNQHKTKCNTCSGYGNKITKEVIHNTLDTYGYTLLSCIDEIKSLKQHIEVCDDCGYKYLTTIDNIRSNNNIRPFHAKNPFTLENINMFCANNNINTRLDLDNSVYKDCYSKLTFICGGCGKPFVTTWNEFSSKERHMCKMCSGGYKLDKLPINTIISNVKSKGYKVLNHRGYKNNKSKITIQDKEGYLYYSTYFYINNYTMDRFSIYNPFTIYNIKLYLKLNGFNNTLISTKYNGVEDKLVFTCQTCGAEFTTSFKNLISSNQTRCKVCSKSKSSLELKVEQYLDEHKLKYVQ